MSLYIFLVLVSVSRSVNIFLDNFFIGMGCFGFFPNGLLRVGRFCGFRNAK